APPRFLSRQRPFGNLTTKLIDPIPVQFHEETALVLARGILTQDDFASPSVDLADRPLAVACMPPLLKTELVDVKADGALKVGHEKHGPGVPLMGNPLACA